MFQVKDTRSRQKLSAPKSLTAASTSPAVSAASKRFSHAFTAWVGEAFATAFAALRGAGFAALRDADFLAGFTADFFAAFFFAAVLAILGPPGSILFCAKL